MAIPWLPDAYPIELLQLTASCIGFAYSVRGTWEAYQDMYFVRASRRNGAREFIARRNLFEEAVRLVIHMLFVFNGVIVVTYPPGPATYLETQRFFQMMVTRWVIMGASVLLTLKSRRDIKDRQYLREILERNLGYKG